MHAIQAVGFDLGETLLFYRETPLNWASLYEPALGAVATSCRLAPSSIEVAAACEVLRQHNTRVFPREHEVRAEQIFSSVLVVWRAPVALLPAAVESFFDFFQQRMCPYPDTLPVLRALCERGLPLGILTDVPYGMPAAFVRRDLRAAGIEEFFSVVLTSGEVGRRKPAAAGFAALAARLGVAPERMLFVGNETKDVIGAQRARVCAVFLDHAGSGANHGQHHTIGRLAEVLPLFQSPEA